MRSGLVFNVSTRISNRFLLCRMLAASARKMHRDGVSTSQCINKSLLALQTVQVDSDDKGLGLNGKQVEEAVAEHAPVPTT